MKGMIIGLLLLAALFCTARSWPNFSYSAQDEWPGVCVKGNMGYQSPIDIDPAKVEMIETNQPELVPLRYYRSGPINGILENVGYSVKFIPDYNTQLLVGPPSSYHYKLQYITFHWGRYEGEGSEHLFHGKAEEFEAQFVYGRLLSGNSNIGTDPEHTLIVAVRGGETHQPVQNDVFNKLDVSPITSYESIVRVNGVLVNDLLPKNLDYYFYRGSMTIPDCNEIVNWVVLKEKIQVPSPYLEQLRQIRDEDGYPIAFNFRNTQDTQTKPRYVYQSAGRF